MNGRMLPKRFERLEIDTTRLLTANAVPSVEKVQDAHIKKKYRADVQNTSILIFILFFCISVALLGLYQFMPIHDPYGDPKNPRRDPDRLISGCVLMAVAIIALGVNCVFTDIDKDPNTAIKEEDA